MVKMFHLSFASHLGKCRSEESGDYFLSFRFGYSTLLYGGREVIFSGHLMFTSLHHRLERREHLLSVQLCVKFHNLQHIFVAPLLYDYNSVACITDDSRQPNHCARAVEKVSKC